ncbi:stage III sporulation protein AG [Neobacillus sp. YIM B06451]|uniref:stage III sporulation protein AG n=1 Tax=Neobacillus sp. YIM B06451 TaxID=3070994 RepID=UPI0037C66729
MTRVVKNKQSPIDWLKSRLFDGQPPGKKTKYQYMALVLCIGAAFMLIGNLFMPGGKEDEAVLEAAIGQGGGDVAAFGQKKQARKTSNDYEQAYERQLKEALEDMLGVGEATVMVNLDSTESKVLEKNTVTKRQMTNERDRDGGTREVEDASVDEQLVIIRNGDKEEPIVIETKKPEIRGVLVVARGADNIEVKKQIIEAVTRALGVPSHRVAVMAKKN